MIKEEDYVKAAKELGVEATALIAVAEVESAGSGFITNKDGERVPKILFERHIMFRRIRDFTPLKSAELARQYPDIVNPTPGGYKGGLSEHERLDRAVQIDRKSALESASWGFGQVMGFHWKLLGYESVQKFVNAAYSDAGQFEIFVRFIKAHPNILRALKAKDWESFARSYNGPDGVNRGYHTKMKQAYERYSSKR